MVKRILNVVSNVAHYDDPTHKTGLWLSELTHAWDQFAEHGRLRDADRAERAMATMLGQLHWWASALRTARNTVPYGQFAA